MEKSQCKIPARQQVDMLNIFKGFKVEGNKGAK